MKRSMFAFIRLLRTRGFRRVLVWMPFHWGPRTTWKWIGQALEAQLRAERNLERTLNGRESIHEERSAN